MLPSRIVGICALLCTASAYIQPGAYGIAKAPHATNLHNSPVLAEAAVDGPSAATAAESGTTVRSLLAGLVFGLVVGLASLVAPAPATADVVVPDRCVRTEGCIGEVADAWAKKKFAEINTTCADFDPSKGKGYLCFDKKFQKATTGAGRYKEFKMDFASPWPIQEKGYRAADKSAWKQTKEEDLRNFKAYLEEKKGSNTAQAPYQWNKNVWDLRK